MGYFENEITLALSPIVMALTQWLKQIIPLPHKLTPVISITVGLILSVVYSYYKVRMFSLDFLISGFLAGLTASGLYSTTKSCVEHFYVGA